MSNASRFVGLLANFERQPTPLHRKLAYDSRILSGYIRVTITAFVLCSDDSEAREVNIKVPMKSTA